MRFSISNTAEYGDYTRGTRVITADTRENMRKILADIQSGEFAREWIAENRAGQENFMRMRAEQAGTQIEAVGKGLRSHMDWIKPELLRARVLAYVFWHRPHASAPPEQYEAACARFHRSLAARPPGGFGASACLRARAAVARRRRARLRGLVSRRGLRRARRA